MVDAFVEQASVDFGRGLVGEAVLPRQVEHAPAFPRASGLWGARLGPRLATVSASKATLLARRNIAIVSWSRCSFRLLFLQSIRPIGSQSSRCWPSSKRCCERPPR